MPIGNSNFSQDFLAGASVANMAAQRQERMMQLRAQAAMQAVQERQIAQEVDMRSQLFQKQMAEDAQDKADTAAYASILREQMDHATASASMSAQETGEPVNLQKIQADVVASTLPGFAAKNPRAALKFANAVKPVMQEQASLERAQILAQGALQRAQVGAESRKSIAEQANETKRYVADQHTAAMVARLKQNGVGHEAATTFALNVNNWREQQAQAEEEGDLDAAAKFGLMIQDAYKAQSMAHPNPTTTLRIKNLQAEATKAYGEWVASGMRNKKLAAEVERTRKALEDAAGQPEGAPQAAPAAKSGTIRVKKPDGTTGTLPASMAEEAKAKGWTILQ